MDWWHNGLCSEICNEEAASLTAGRVLSGNNYRQVHFNYMLIAFRGVFKAGPLRLAPPFEAEKNYEKSKINRKLKERGQFDIVYFR